MFRLSILILGLFSMNLKFIKLFGFKSFVDPTVIPLPGQLNGIVGPNGCGKSNVVDAIRWVIGESSAKQLRGQAMSDVIFNGSNERKPVGKAAVELIFDNSSGRMGGEFAKFSEISVRREVFKEGNAQYFLNGTHCRRRDIIDLFLGTGLGPRSYAIIEQGMISQLIEAKPEEFRLHLEEAAGISKYKERRKETEQRIRQTQENIDRLNDILVELDRQMKHLQRQANAAERYKELKSQLRLIKARFHALQLKSLAILYQEQDSKINQYQLEIDQKISDLRQSEAKQNDLKEHFSDLSENRDQIQQVFYTLMTEVAKNEQEIKHRRQQINQWEKELEENKNNWQDLKATQLKEENHKQELLHDIEALSPKLQHIKELKEEIEIQHADAEEKMKTWQQESDFLQKEVANKHQQKEITKTKLDHFNQQLQGLLTRKQKLMERQSQFNLAEIFNQIDPLTIQYQELEEKLSEMQSELTSGIEKIGEQKGKNQQIKQKLAVIQEEIRKQQQLQASIEGQQQAALGYSNDQINQFLNEFGIMDCSRLIKEIEVQAGWELAVETVLSGFFDAVCIDQAITTTLSSVSNIQKGRLTLLAKGKNPLLLDSNAQKKTLADCIKSAWPIDDWINQIYVAENAEEAQILQKDLLPGESIITREGIWIGYNWLRLNRSTEKNSGLIQREQKLRELVQEILNLKKIKDEADQQLLEGEDCLLNFEKNREQLYQFQQQLSRQYSEVGANLSGLKSKQNTLEQEEARLLHELEIINQQESNLSLSIEEMEGNLQIFLLSYDEMNSKQQIHLEKRNLYQTELHLARQNNQNIAQQENQFSSQLTTNQKQLILIDQMLEKGQQHLLKILNRSEILEKQLTEATQPIEAIQLELQNVLEKKFEKEKELEQIDLQLSEFNEKLKNYQKSMEQVSSVLEVLKSKLQELQMNRQETSVRQRTIMEQLVEQDIEVENLLADLPQEITLSDLEKEQEIIESRIARLGPINLAAIEEYQTISERKNYLDKQSADLIEALAVLNNAMSKIDRETRLKFKDTFEQVNQSFQTLFPKIFGGGKAELILEEENLLTTGVMVKAQPPGKRNNSVHVLSGGEKALTAIALVFSLFQLNPAPFCILDEVDAPLDDSNVTRFCNLVKEMSQHTQFIVISHNKVTISFSEHLMGVTMREPGVSRIVSVDLQQAVAMME